MPKTAFSEKFAVPKFADLPSAVLIVGDVDFFVEEAAARVRKALGGEDAEVLRFEDDAPSEAVSDALLNRSLFSARRVVELDISRLLGTESPGRLVTNALEAWGKGGAGGRREAFKHARALLAALDLSSGADPVENAEAAAKRVRKKDDAPLLAEILKELPEEKSGGPAVLKAALRTLLERTENDGTVALLTAVSPPAGVDLLQEITARGLVLETSVGKDRGPALRRLASALAREREVTVEPAAIERLLRRTDEDAGAFDTELRKLLEWAGNGGRIRATDVEANVEDEASEDVYGLFDAIGRRNAGEAMQKIERLFDGRDVIQGDWKVKKIEEVWPQQFLRMLTDEIRRMLIIRARFDQTGAAFSASTSYPEFQARLLPRLLAPVAPFEGTGLETSSGKIPPAYALYRIAQRSSRFTTNELSRAVSRTADLDVRLKSSAPVVDTLCEYVAQLIAGR